MYGTILVDKNGKTLYTLTNGGHAVSCTGACASAWPPLLLPSGQPATHNGLALYTFSGDQSPGQANGEGISSFGGVWHVVKVSGTGSTSPSSGPSGTGGSSGTTTTSTGNGGYGY
jgi:predicted lipoprotein with Yx(FWY)xxD motif